MTSEINFKPHLNETPSQYADRLAIQYSRRVSNAHKKSFGQYFTPLPIARFLAELQNTNLTAIRILDPGCGIGILSAALCEKVAQSSPTLKEITLTAFETDIEILPFSESCLKHLAVWLKEHGIEFTYFLCKNDFVLHNTYLLGAPTDANEQYDIIISNPPYFKLPKGDERITASRSVIHGQSNIYSIFMIIAARLLKPNGELIFITPRSFCSGSYFRLFRELFFDLVELGHIHLFNSRSSAFKRDKVLQENIIVVGRRKREAHSAQMQIVFGPQMEKNILISSSEGVTDIDHRHLKSYPAKRILDLDSYQKTLYLPVTENDELILNQFGKWKGSLEKFGLQISTGPVVDFRSTEFISATPRLGTVPLIWLHNIYSMEIKWPSLQEKGKPKGQYIQCEDESLSRLVANRNYVLLRRFSSKDDKSRLIAAPYLKSTHPEMVKIGIENHLNYIYHTKRELKRHEAVGLAALLNSRLFDLYFRIFNGNINVSATELRNFPLPNFELIEKLGKVAVAKLNKNESIDVDKLVKSIFKINLALPEPEWTK